VSSEEMLKELQKGLMQGTDSILTADIGAESSLPSDELLCRWGVQAGE
jgi:hypothetical protein